MKNKKVYCINCSHLNYGGIYWKSECTKIIGQKDTALRQENINVEDYEKQNENNDCEYFSEKVYKPVPRIEAKWWEFWIRKDK